MGQQEQRGWQDFASRRAVVWIPRTVPQVTVLGFRLSALSRVGAGRVEGQVRKVRQAGVRKGGVVEGVCGDGIDG